MERTSNSYICPPAAGASRATSLSLTKQHLLAGVEVVVVHRRFDVPIAVPVGTRLVQQVVGGDQVVVHGVPQMRQIDPAEGAVPVAAIALAAVEFASCPIQVLAVDAVAFGLVEAAADHHHAAVHLVGFGVLDLKVPPEPAADERLDPRPPLVVLQLVNRALVRQLLRRPATPIPSFPDSCSPADRSCPAAER